MKKVEHKKDPYKELSNRVDETNSKVDRLSEKVESIAENFDVFKNKVYELLDKVMGELKAIREEQTVMSSYKDQLEDHETRILTLEKD